MSPAEDHGCRCWVPVCLGRTCREAGAPVPPAGARDAEGSVAGVLGKLFLRTFSSFFSLIHLQMCHPAPPMLLGRDCQGIFKNEIFKRFHPTPLHFILASWKSEIEICFIPQVFSFFFFFFYFFSPLYCLSI